MNTEKQLALKAARTDGLLQALIESAFEKEQIAFSVVQTAHGFILGDWLYQASGVWAKADNSDETTFAQAIVSDVVSTDEFEVATAGHVSGLSGLTAGATYYLSDTAGSMAVAIPATGLVQDLGKATSANSFEIGTLRPILIEKTGIPVTQTTHGFVVGDWVYLNAGTWAKADNSAIGSLAQGVVNKVLDVDTFEVQKTGVFTTTGLTADVPYFLSDTAGTISNAISATGFVQQVGFALSATQLELSILLPTPQQALGETITQAAHGFVATDWLYNNAGTWTKAVNTGLSSFAEGVVSRVWDANTFELQRQGTATGFSALSVGSDYYLDSTAGGMTNDIPATGFHQKVGVARSATTLEIASLVPATENAVVVLATQNGHGFAVGDWVWGYGAANWSKANKDLLDNFAEGMVSEVITANRFKVTLWGEVFGLSGLSAGSKYYLDTTPGSMTTTLPATGRIQVLGRAITADRFRVIPDRGTFESIFLEIDETATEPRFSIHQSGTGDASMRFRLEGTQDFIMGIDNDDGDKFKLSANDIFGTNDCLVINPNTLDLGIGVAAPTEAVEIKAKAGLATRVNILADGGAGIRIKSDEDNNGTDSDASVRLYTDTLFKGELGLDDDDADTIKLHAGGSPGFAGSKGITIDQSGQVNITDELKVNGNVGFYSNNPQAQPSAYIQTYSASDKTHANMTSNDLSVTSQSGGWGYSSQAESDSIQTELNALRADLIDLKQLVNSIIDDLQNLGLFQ